MTDTYARGLGRRLRELRTERALTQEAVAKHLGVTQVAYNRYETGARTASAEVLDTLATWWELPPSDCRWLLMQAAVREQAAPRQQDGPHETGDETGRAAREHGR